MDDRDDRAVGAGGGARRRARVRRPFVRPRCCSPRRGRPAVARRSGDRRRRVARAGLVAPVAAAHPDGADPRRHVDRADRRRRVPRVAGARPAGVRRRPAPSVRPVVGRPLEPASEDALGRLLFPAREEIVIAPEDDRSPAGRSVGSASILVDERAFEIWRIGRGDPRMGVDFEAGALPAEAGLERLIDVTKGCFLGQESVAKVRNLGHPPTVLRHLRCDTQSSPRHPYPRPMESRPGRRSDGSRAPRPLAAAGPC